MVPPVSATLVSLMHDHVARYARRRVPGVSHGVLTCRYRQSLRARRSSRQPGRPLGLHPRLRKRATPWQLQHQLASEAGLFPPTTAVMAQLLMTSGLRGGKPAHPVYQHPVDQRDDEPKVC